MNERLTRQRPEDAITVDSVQELQELLRAGTHVIPIGNRTKPALSCVHPEFTPLRMSGLSGITQYESSEFTFTALAGTPLREITETLADKQQYLPFDPMLSEANATLAGTLAAGLSGPGRHRYGGIRDFVLGAHFVCGDGELIRGGGKVVKNAAGFDLPKLLVGSCGRLGVITELTFKVFPRSGGLHSFCLPCDDHRQATQRIAAIARGRWELDAIDYEASDRTLWLRVSGEGPVAQAICNDIISTVKVPGLQASDKETAHAHWSKVSELQFDSVSQPAVVKIPLSLNQVADLADWCDQTPQTSQIRFSVAGNLGWLAVSDDRQQDLNAKLIASKLRGAVIRGSLNAPGRYLIGQNPSNEVTAAVKQAMDPSGLFPHLAGG